MKRTSKFLGAVSGISLIAFSASPAFAANTTAGNTITNTVTVNYQVGGIAQTQEEASDTFTVDRKIDLLVEEVGTSTTTVSPGEQNVVTTFDVTNLSNDVLDFALSAAQLSGGTAAHGGTDNFNTANLEIWVDTDGSGDLSSGDTLISYIDELAADTGSPLDENTMRVFVVSDVPLTASTDDVAGVVLTATAAEGGTAESQGSNVSQSNSGDIDTEDTLFADVLGVTDLATDGKHSAGDDYTVLAALLSVLKESRVVSDPINGTDSPLAIPGATIEYCIKVSNAADSATATTVAIADIVPGDLTYVTGSAKVNGAVDSGTGACSAGLTDGSYASGTLTVSGTIPSVAAGETRNLLFQATIN